jgi:hypothetical protein
MMIKNQESKFDTVSDLQRKPNGAEQLILTWPILPPARHEL